MPVRMMDKGLFENARTYAKSAQGCTLSLWLGTDGNGAVVRADHTSGRQTFTHYTQEESARAAFASLAA